MNHLLFSLSALGLVLATAFMLCDTFGWAIITEKDLIHAVWWTVVSLFTLGKLSEHYTTH